MKFSDGKLLGVVIILGLGFLLIGVEQYRRYVCRRALRARSYLTFDDIYNT
jgi:hypothetical protein